MSTLGKIVVCASPVLLLCALSNAADSESQGNPYQEISNTNIFRLKPPETLLLKPTEAPVPKVTLLGITTLLPDKRALLLVQFPPHPPEPAGQQHYVLAQGQRAGLIEVVAIDERSGRVRLLVSGEPMLLSFETSRPGVHNNGREL